MILLQRQDVIRTGIDDRLRNGFLAAHGIDATAPRRSSSPSRSGIAVISLDFSAIACGASAQRARPANALTRCAAGLVPTPSHRRAVHADRLVGQARQGGRGPSGEGRLEGCPIDSPQHVAPCVVRGNPVGQLQKPPQPGLLLLGKVRYAHPVLYPAQHRAEYHHQNIMEFVELVPRLATRIGQVGQIRARVEPPGQHQVSPSDQSRPVTLAVPLLSTPHIARLPCAFGPVK